MVTAYDVAAQAGVSMGTVSRYLTGNGYVGAASREKISAAIAELGFVPNRAAASLTTKTTGLLGFVASDLRNPFTAEVASALGRRARELQYGLVVSESMDDPELAVEALELLRAHGIDGLVVTPPESEVLNAAVVSAAATMPVVGIGLRTDPPVTDLVTSDTQGGAALAMEHFVSLGHSHIAYVGSSTMASGRYRGYVAALETNGLELDTELVITGALNRQLGQSAFEELMGLEDPPTAIFAANDAVALGVLQAAHSRGVSVPSELSVVGYDDVDMARHSVPPLTTVAQPMAEMGVAAIDLLVARLKQSLRGEAQQVQLPSELIIRDSTAPSPGTQPSSEGQE